MGQEREKFKMCSRVRYLLVCAFMILLCPVLSPAADLESAKRAYGDKDYAKALKEATPLAEQGNAEEIGRASGRGRVWVEVGAGGEIQRGEKGKGGRL